MKTSARGLQVIHHSESFSATVYYCSANVATVGWGHVLKTPAGQQIDADVFGKATADRLAAEAMQRMFGRQSITRAEADGLFAKDLATYEAAVNTITDASTHQCEYDAMVSMCFNIGKGGFTTSAVARHHREGRRKVGTVSLSGLKKASQEKAEPNNIQIAFVRWSNSNGRWTLGLFRRRLAELLVYGGKSADVAISTAWSVK